MAALSNSEIWKPLLIAIALGALFFGGFKARAFVVCLLMSLLIAEGITSILKSAIDRHRPKPGPSFPSGHMTNNTITAVYLTFFYRRRGWLYWIIAAAVGYSRIYLGAHWPSDVIATLFLATGEALLLLGFFELIWRTAARRWTPDMYARHPSLIGNLNSQAGNSRHFR